MAHVIIIIDEAIDSLKGNATTGDLADLRIAVDAADAYIVNLGKASDIIGDQLHEILEDVQEFLTDDSTSSLGAKDRVCEFVTSINTTLP